MTQTVTLKTEAVRSSETSQQTFTTRHENPKQPSKCASCQPYRFPITAGLAVHTLAVCTSWNTTLQSLVWLWVGNPTHVFPGVQLSRCRLNWPYRGLPLATFLTLWNESLKDGRFGGAVTWHTFQRLLVVSCVLLLYVCVPKDTGITSCHPIISLSEDWGLV
jgi:hypothetical protein